MSNLHYMPPNGGCGSKTTDTAFIYGNSSGKKLQARPMELVPVPDRSLSKFQLFSKGISKTDSSDMQGRRIYEQSFFLKDVVTPSKLDQVNSIPPSIPASPSKRTETCGFLSSQPWNAPSSLREKCDEKKLQCQPRKASSTASSR